MRFILIILFLLSALGYGVYSIFFKHDGIGGFVNHTAGLDRVAPVVSSSPPAGVSSVGSPSPASADFASINYHFKNRVPPSVSDVTIASFLSCNYTFDHLTRNSYVTGRLADCLKVISYLEKIDQVSDSCAVHAWAVYVDKSAAVGFDLAALISSFTESDFTVEANASGVVLNLDTNSIKAALDVISNGSTIDVVQRPYVHLVQGVPARVESIQEIPLPETSLSQGISQTSIVYKKVGLEMEITPYFLDDSTVRLSVLQKNGLIGNSVKIGSDEIPVVQTQSVSSTVEMGIGKSVVFGGVTTYRQTHSKGFLKNVSEVQEGILYVVISTVSSVPKAILLPQDLDPDSSSKLDLPDNTDKLDDWIDGELLPSKIRSALSGSPVRSGDKFSRSFKK